MREEAAFGDIPSVDRLLRSEAAADLIERHGRAAVTAAFRSTLSILRAACAQTLVPHGATGTDRPAASAHGDELALSSIVEQATRQLDERLQPSPRAVFNLTGTILHTNLGRAALPDEAIEAITRVARGASDLEFDLTTGGRGDRDAHVESLLCELTGAEAATVVNNNAAAVLLVLRSLANRREVPTSRGELIEIGDSFRLPDIVRAAGCRLCEVGTTNRTHLRDFAEVIGPRTGAVLKAHASNYEIVGFTSSVDEAALAALCREHAVPFVIDLGSGSLVDLRTYDLPYEPTPTEALARGADIVTFSGDKLLGGPQAGIIVGRADLVAKIRRNPLKRALRVDKLTVAALAAVLRLYSDPQRLVRRLPTLRMLQRTAADIAAAAQRLRPACASALDGVATVDAIACESQVGSGAQPLRALASAGLAIRPEGAKQRGTALKDLAAAFRRLPLPVVGRIRDGALIFDLRALEDEAGFVSQLPLLWTGTVRCP
ncbi:MAG: L-seryl-tRNA(Sec) selenium transferase [Burkholderiaceae bacterium]|nr:L-seryl-tRNA(Sec) selenium transferase [Burkholderiaceae bacterium]